MKSMEVRAIEVHDPLQALENKVVPKKETIKEEPLNLKEKLKLKLYQQLFKNRGAKNDSSEGVTGERGVLGEMFDSVISMIAKTGAGKAIENMKQDFENLEERNKKVMDKFLNMLENNIDCSRTFKILGSE